MKQVFKNMMPNSAKSGRVTASPSPLPPSSQDGKSSSNRDVSKGIGHQPNTDSSASFSNNSTKGTPVATPQVKAQQQPHQLANAVQPPVSLPPTQQQQQQQQLQPFFTDANNRARNGSNGSLHSSTSSLSTGKPIQTPSTKQLKEAIRENIDQPQFLFRKSDYHFLRTLGSGSYAMVKEAIHLPTQQKVAVKMIEKARMKHREDRLRCEIEILTRVSHRNLLRLLDWGLGKQTIYLVTELAQGGELFDCIIKNGHFFEQDAARIIYTIFEAVEHLHEHSIVHRDLKPENIFMRDVDQTDYTNLVIGDFGIARIIDENKQFLQTKIGSGGYIAPEVLMGRPYGKECDIWSIGVIAYILLSGSVPYRGGDFAAELHHILHHPVSFDDDIWTTISGEAKDLIVGCMQIDPARRITAAQALSHMWFEIQFHEETTTGRDLLPSLRGTIDQERAMRELSDTTAQLSIGTTASPATKRPHLDLYASSPDVQTPSSHHQPKQQQSEPGDRSNYQSQQTVFGTVVPVGSAVVGSGADVDVKSEASSGFGTKEY